MMAKNSYDVIVLGAGSVGVPCALSLAEEGLKTLVIESLPSIGQGQNKAAIGGIRATHSDGSKIRTCLKSIEVFSEWQKKFGDDIGWQKGGYTFPVYAGSDEKLIKGTLDIQKGFGLKIDWVDSGAMREMVPGINPDGLRGGTYSPNDGNASPLLAINAFYRRSLELGARFRFNEKAVEILAEAGKVRGVKTTKDIHHAPFVVNAAGGGARDLGLPAGPAGRIGGDLPITCDSHEGGITEPVERFFEPLVVDIRPGKGSKNIYLYQNSEGQVVFCLTPEPLIMGTDTRSTSSFLPLISERILALIPRLTNIKIRRVWRGLYPMTPDGFPIVDAAKAPEGLIVAVGMCGQGFMLGPGVANLVQKMITNNLSEEDRKTLQGFRLNRDFSKAEKFK